jgi:HEAT repeat protein
LATDLDAADAALRRHAAREILRCPESARSLLSRLLREEESSVREAILSSLVRLEDPAVASELATFLRSDDPALRNQVIDALRECTADLSPVLKSLLGDPDPDLRIFAVNILESNRHPDVERWLIEVIERDEHVNVCATAVDLLCEIGTEAAIEPLLRVQARFAAEPYLQFAVALAFRRIHEA